MYQEEIKEQYFIINLIINFIIPRHSLKTFKIRLSRDALLSLLSLCLASKLPNELSLFSGSLAAAQSVEIIGNKESINKTKILKFIEHILNKPSMTKVFITGGAGCWSSFNT